MTTPARDKAEGTAEEAKGRVKSAAGDLTGNRRLKVEGFQDRASGTVKRVAGGAKSKFAEVVDTLTKKKKGS
jgi:uncharacterized protein YjbJ (UPF0337 family)